ncbi:bone morphogenetic protein receptor type-2 isoform X2 [Parasteatoda tepidariorum]|uniref:bone morphogenetic protein receptor type-2 isoform X2 n=1 Tax=Parasteatoda tepidariorum TaxID=114398 RepID=UPI001C7225EA|nr:bone morphogenetic protein receptor type-2 isoform X2 [Parasteatoda tepidariorum]
MKGVESHDETHPLCHYLKTPMIKQINVTVGSLLDDNSTVRCAKPTDSCYILWQEDSRNKTIKIVSQGCWNDGNQKCHQNECIPDSKSNRAQPKTRFCCCDGNFCNSNFTDNNNSSDSPAEHDPTYVGPLSHSWYIFIIIAVVFASFFSFIVFLWYRFACTVPKRSNESLHLMEAPPPSSPNFDLDTLKIQELCSRGRYGAVYRACLNDQSVAVKRFTHQNQQHFLSERAIYVLPFIEHSSIPKFIGSKEQKDEDGRTEFLLVVSFSPHGCLKDYLKENTIDWNHLRRMIESVACGLAHLHSEIKKGDKRKPCIVHRDLTSRNILVKSDGTCMLCDFGFAIQITGSTYIHNGVEVKAEETSLADVGTLRYMAPEILEGAVNLRDCESSLKQTDVYALGLVMWEIATRCSDLYQGVEVPQYKLPYEAEVGNEPTMEQMQTLVVKHKSRPLFPDIWKTTNPAIRSLKETIEDCWDQDAEARLTALCVQERISELLVLWEWHKAGLSGSGISPSLNNVSNLEKSNNNKSGNDSVFGSGSLDDQFIIPRERSNSISECTTETLLSPSDAQNNDKNIIANNSSPGQKVSYPLQPHQGRNPCLERNLNQEAPDVIGNRLLDCTLKYPGNNKIFSFSDGDANIFSLPPGMTSTLMPNGLTNHSTRIPIPYVQNPVNSSATIPKVTNLTSSNYGHNSRSREERRWSPLNIFDNKKGFKTGWKNLLDRKTSCSNGYIPEEQQPLQSSAISSPISPSDYEEKQGQINPQCEEKQGPLEPFWPVEPKNDHSNFNVNCTNVHSHSLGIASEECAESPNCRSLEELKIPTKSDCPTLINILPDQIVSVEDKSKRPTTLPVHCLSNEFDEDFFDLSDSETTKELVNISESSALPNENQTVQIRRKGSGGKRNGIKRVKTPFEIKGRFSLYDDRIMSSVELPGESSKPNHSQLDSNKFSVSVPLNMNVLCSPPGTDQEQASPKQIKFQENVQVKPRNGFTLPVSSNVPQNVFSFNDI